MRKLAVAVALSLSSINTPDASAFFNHVNCYRAFSMEETFPQDSEVYTQALFGSPDTELFGVKHFAERALEEVRSSRFSYVAAESMEGETVDFFTINHWNGEDLVEKNVALSLILDDPCAHRCVIKEVEAGELNELYSITLTYTTDTDDIKGNIELKYKSHGVEVNFKIPTSFEQHYTWEMFKKNELLPPITVTDKSLIEASAEIYGFVSPIYESTTPGTSRNRELNDFIKTVNSLFREVMLGYKRTD